METSAKVGISCGLFTTNGIFSTTYRLHEKQVEFLDRPSGNELIQLNDDKSLVDRELVVEKSTPEYIKVIEQTEAEIFSKIETTRKFKRKS